MTDIIKKVVFSEDKKQAVITFKGFLGLFTTTRVVAISKATNLLGNQIYTSWYYLDTGEWLTSNLERVINFWLEQEINNELN